MGDNLSEVRVLRLKYKLGGLLSALTFLWMLLELIFKLAPDMYPATRNYM